MGHYVSLMSASTKISFAFHFFGYKCFSCNAKPDSYIIISLAVLFSHRNQLDNDIFQVGTTCIVILSKSNIFVMRLFFVIFSVNCQGQNPLESNDCCVCCRCVLPITFHIKQFSCNSNNSNKWVSDAA